ncbi:MAG: Uma2 family endonuclease [Chloroflexi bacterium]|nr:Uma2 family endonuclease [Chloroflexota bacterium]
MLARKKMFFTPEEYLNMEEAAAYKSEYYNGEIFAMAGGTSDHSLVAVSLTVELGQQLKGKPCRLYNSDMRLYIKQGGLFTYPDIMVVCGKIEFMANRKDTLANPLLIVEVLSDSTRAYDRGEKFNFYKTLPTLQEYILVECETARVERYQRAGEKWTVETYEGLDAIVPLESIDCQVVLKMIYDKVSWVD